MTKTPKKSFRLLPDKDINGCPIYSKGKDTARKEAFAQHFHKTRSWREAYTKAYTAENMDATSVRVAANKIRKDPWVQERIMELDAELAEKTRLSLAQIIEQLQEDRLLAHREGQAAAAVQADMHIAKILGFYWDRRQVIVATEDIDRMDIKELRSYVEAKAQALGIANGNGHLAIDYAPQDYEVVEEEAPDGD